MADATDATGADSSPPASKASRTWQEEEVRARRLRAEAAKHAELVKKQEQRALRDASMSDADSAMVRLEEKIAAIPKGKAHDASRAGLRKQLAALKAAGLREQRKREQAEREKARRAQMEAQARAAQAETQAAAHDAG